MLLDGFIRQCGERKAVTTEEDQFLIQKLSGRHENKSSEETMRKKIIKEYQQGENCNQVDDFCHKNLIKILSVRTIGIWI